MPNSYSHSSDAFICDQAYTDGWEYILDELELLDLRIRLLLIEHKEYNSENPLNNYSGLVLTQEEVLKLIEKPSTTTQNSNAELIIERIHQLDFCIKKRRYLSAENGIFLPFTYLSEVFNLSTFEEQCIIICLAIELDRKYEKLFSFLQDDITSKNPNVDLVMKLFCTTPEEKLAARLYFAPNAKLPSYFLKQDDSDMTASLLSRKLKLDEEIINFILGAHQVDNSIQDYTEIFRPDRALPQLFTGKAVQNKIRKFVEINYINNQSKKAIVFYFSGPSGSGKKLQAKHFCCYFNQPLMIVNLLLAYESDQVFSEMMKKIFREAILQQVVLCFEHFDVLLKENDTSNKMLKELIKTIKTYNGIIFLLAKSPWKPINDLKEHVFIDIKFNIPGDIERRQLWEQFAEEYNFETEIDWGTLASKFHFTPGQIQAALTKAQDMSNWNHIDNKQISKNELYEACYAQTQHKLETRAARIRPTYTWDDIILPQEQKEQLKNACSQVRYRHIVYGEWGFEQKLAYGKGLSMLFSGPPGTGKTMSAQVIARELSLELYKVDLSQVISKYIGETEKNLQEIFSEAELSSSVLFFDETDALFGKRSEVKDSHDRYSNIETSFLLQKMEEYPGITIMTTNFIQNIDKAFMRRINFVIEFPFPDAEHRRKIWKSMFPKKAPLSKDINFNFLSNKFEISGGNIKNIAVAAAFLAAENSEPIGMKHIVRAAKYELLKMGKILLREDLDEYYSII